jgi:hypothetical protein
MFVEDGEISCFTDWKEEILWIETVAQKHSSITQPTFTTILCLGHGFELTTGKRGECPAKLFINTGNHGNNKLFEQYEILALELNLDRTVITLVSSRTYPR